MTQFFATVGAIPKSLRVAILGGGELGKELVIACQHWGIETIVFDKYAAAPAMQVAHRCYVVDMLDPSALQTHLLFEKPNYLLWETEEFALPILTWAEAHAIQVVPSAAASERCLNRSQLLPFLRDCDVPVPDYRIVTTLTACEQAVHELGFPCVIKPNCTSSGQGQSMIDSARDLSFAWNYALEGGRGANTTVLVLQHIPFDQEFCLLALHSRDGLRILKPIGYVTDRGGLQEAWQPEPLVPTLLIEAHRVVEKIMGELKEPGVFAFEFFQVGESVILGEVSCGPNDIGFVTLAGQRVSQFDLHLRTILDLPIPADFGECSAALRTILAQRESDEVAISGIGQALKNGRVTLRLFGKPVARPLRRMGLVLATGEDSARARAEAERAWRHIAVNEF